MPGRFILAWIAFENEEQCIMTFLGRESKKMRRGVLVLEKGVGARNELIQNSIVFVNKCRMS